VHEVSEGASLLVLERIGDHENLGALFRTAAALGVAGVVLDPTCADPWYRRSVRVSMGAVFGLPFARAEDWPGVVRWLSGAGFEVVALTPGGSERLDEVRADPEARPAVLVGAEGPGLSPAALDLAPRHVRIPMAGGMDSLNVGHAAAIACHHLVTSVSRPDGRAAPRDAR
jgi:tRNA G18 (ribose-2'-O)-methylase SpoU